MIPIHPGRRYRFSATTVPAGVDLALAFYDVAGKRIAMERGEVATAPANATHAALVWPAGAFVVRPFIGEAPALLADALTTGRAARRRASRLDRKPRP